MIRPHPCIVLLVDMLVAGDVDAMRTPLEHHGDAMHEDTPIVVTRIRPRVCPGARTTGGFGGETPGGERPT